MRITRTFFILFFSAMMLLKLTPLAVFADQHVQEPLKIIVDGETLDPDVPPVIQEGRTMVEMRSVFEALGARLFWDGETRTVTATREGLVLSLTIGETTAFVQGETHELDVPAYLTQGRTIIPARFAAESLGAEVSWDGATRTVTITTAEKEYTVIPQKEVEVIPEEIQSWIEDSRRIWLAQEKSHEDALYILVTYGEKPTGGYVVEIQHVVEQEGEIFVTVHFTKPAEDEPVSMALTYPYDLYIIEDTDKPVTYLPVGAEEYIPTLMGVDELEPIVAESNWLKVFNPAPGASVSTSFALEGVANVFEGTVLYELQDSEGQELDSGFTTGAMGDWGHFEATVSVPEEVVAGEELLLLIYTRSAKDGSIENLIEIPLEKEAGNST